MDLDPISSSLSVNPPQARPSGALEWHGSTIIAGFNLKQWRIAADIDSKAQGDKGTKEEFFVGTRSWLASWGFGSFWVACRQIPHPVVFGYFFLFFRSR